MKHTIGYLLGQYLSNDIDNYYSAREPEEIDSEIARLEKEKAAVKELQEEIAGRKEEFKKAIITLDPGFSFKEFEEKTTGEQWEYIENLKESSVP